MTSPITDKPDFNAIEQQVCRLAAEQLGLRYEEVLPTSRLVEDLNCDSLEMVELMMSIEETFGITLPEQSPDPVYKAVFTRRPFRMHDFVELILLRWGTGTAERPNWTSPPYTPADPVVAGFTQLGGRLSDDRSQDEPLFESLGSNASGYACYRRRTDGMQCVMIPEANVAIGSSEADAPVDETPQHPVKFSPFLIDVEPISTTAYARFLNSIAHVNDDMLHDWFVLDATDHRHEHVVLESTDDGWRPKVGTEHWPMILVSWYGANAYALWANRRDWRDYKDDDLLLPSEAQWEYVARGPMPQRYPWGDSEPDANTAVFGLHRRGATYALDELPLVPVHANLGLSPFGLRHMAGNVWNWCRDWYDPKFYSDDRASGLDAVNDQSTGIRSERGGSWVGPAVLIRSSFRRGRMPAARGRCLGFRCVSRVEDIA